MNNEIWVEVKGYEGFYEISSLGRVRSMTRKVTFVDGKTRVFYGQMLKPTKDNAGYYKVHFTKDGKKKMFRVHKLLAEHFIDNPEGCEVVNFADMNRENLNLDNLVWVSQQDSNQRGADKTKELAKARKDEKA